MKAKLIIINALGYLVLPFDFIPDFALGVGFTDDLGVMLLAIQQVQAYVTDEIKEKANAKAKELISMVDDSEKGTRS